jgi:hypothetical protein
LKKQSGAGEVQNVLALSADITVGLQLIFGHRIADLLPFICVIRIYTYPTEVNCFT